MASNSPPTRLDGELYDYARIVGSAMSRSTAQQITHWARIGREVEASASVSQSDIAAVLVGARVYDELNTHEQAAVRAEWTERMKARRQSLDLTGDFSASGRPYATLDENGEVVIRNGEGLDFGLAGAGGAG